MTHAIAPILFILVWSTGFVVARAVAPEADPNLFLAARFLCAAAVLALLARGAGAAWPRLRDLPRHLLAGALLHGLYLGAGYWAVAQGLPAAIMALAGALQPPVTAVLAQLFFAERPSPRSWLGMALGLGGVALAVAPGLARAGAEPVPVSAILAALVSVAGITAGTLFQKTSLARCDLRGAGAVQLLGGALVVAASALVLGESRWSGSAALWLNLGYAALALSVGGATLLVWMVRRGEAAAVTALLFLAPPLAAVQAYLLFGQALSGAQWAGFGVALAGVFLAGRR